MSSNKGKIGEIRNRRDKLYLRILNDEVAQKRYLQFREELLDKYSLRKRGKAGFTELYNEQVDINIFYGDDYYHLVIYGNQEDKGKIIGMLRRYFETVEAEK